MSKDTGLLHLHAQHLHPPLLQWGERAQAAAEKGCEWRLQACGHPAPRAVPEATPLRLRLHGAGGPLKGRGLAAGWGAHLGLASRLESARWRPVPRAPRPAPQEKAISIWETKNFFFELEPLPGAVQAVKQMASLQNTDVFICTSPIKMFKYCPYEKYAWVEKHFGPDFLEQIVLTRDKTVVSADILIDDRPDITGAEPHPTWEHVLFTSCHNQHLQLQPPHRRLLSWADDWKAILDSKRPH
ncbi:5'(3')-deoxyribonucleotidase, mitochondrial isoform X2 [Ictidomys tridecemlineatus]